MRKWIYRSVVIVVLTIIGMVAALFWTAQRTQHPVGFALARGTNALGQPFAIAMWYPTSETAWPTTPLGVTLMSVARDGRVEGQQLPLVVISHGNGAGPGSHADLALTLADAGYVVAAPMHSGDNAQDSSGLSGPTFWSNRNHEVRATIEYMLADWPDRQRIDAGRIGAFGFSAGGFTVLTAVGARPDFGVIRTHCANSPEFVCDVLRSANSPLLGDTAGAVEGGVTADPRIKAAVVAAPGLGFTFAGGGLSGVRVPLQLWTGERDRVIPDASNGAIIRRQVAAIESHSVAGAGHVSFLAPCALFGPPALCADEGSFDRRAFHRDMNAEIVSFFRRTLGARTE
jgi:predicted dienelactone hydrolase